MQILEMVVIKTHNSVSAVGMVFIKEVPQFLSLCYM